MIEYTVKVDDEGTVRWYLNNRLHCEHGPAAIRADGSKAWCLNGKRHRIDGPAFEHENGHKEWWLDGKRLTESEFNARVNVKEVTVAQVEELLGYRVKIVK